MKGDRSGIDLREIERAQDRKLKELGFILWTIAMIVLGMLLAKFVG